MPDTGLRKEWHARSEIDLHVPSDAAIGVFVLGAPNGRGGYWVDFVARTSAERGALRRALHAHDGAFENCTHFKFETFADEVAAFERESRIWHVFRPERNERHPAAPNGAIGCPLPDCSLAARYSA
jgi:hypothetical protein